MSTAGRWEIGSAFPLVLPSGAGWIDVPDPIRYYGSGRQALVALLDFGRSRYGWATAYLPEYYCPEVLDSIERVIRVRRYDAGPVDSMPLDGGEPLAVDPDGVVIAVSYFGMPPATVGCPHQASSSPMLIIDVTHDPFAPWLSGVPADYVFASLRKTLPLPDGGAVWSPGGHELPPSVPPSDTHLAAVAKTLSAMALKTAYLDGAELDKAAYLALYAAGEDGLRSTTVSGISEYSREALRVLPVEELRWRRTGNVETLASALGALDGATVHAYPFGVVLECSSPDLRETIRRGLIARCVYPAVLWSLSRDQAGPGHVDFSRRMLLLHADFRWDEGDMGQVAALVRELDAEALQPEGEHDADRTSGWAAAHAGR